MVHHCTHRAYICIREAHEWVRQQQYVKTKQILLPFLRWYRPGHQGRQSSRESRASQLCKRRGQAQPDFKMACPSDASSKDINKYQSKFCWHCLSNFPDCEALRRNIRICTGTLTQRAGSHASESRAKFDRCTRWHLKPAYQVQIYATSSLDDVSSYHPHRNSHLICVNPYKTNGFCV